MSSVKFLKETEYKPTFRTEQICGIYDLVPEKKLKKEFDFDIDLNFDWQVGLIVGTSGSGKTSLAKQLFKNNYVRSFKWDNNSAFINEFPKDISIKEISKCLANVGFASPPLWLLPYSALSTGQQFRVDIVRALLQNTDMVCFDEFTSVVDRDVAKTKKPFLAQIQSPSSNSTTPPSKNARHRADNEEKKYVKLIEMCKKHRYDIL